MGNFGFGIFPSVSEIGRYKSKVEQLLVDKQNLEKRVAESSQIAKNVDSYLTSINKLEQDLQSRRLQEEQNNRKLAGIMRNFFQDLVAVPQPRPLALFVKTS